MTLTRRSFLFGAAVLAVAASLPTLNGANREVIAAARLELADITLEVREPALDVQAASLSESSILAEILAMPMARPTQTVQIIRDPYGVCARFQVRGITVNDLQALQAQTLQAQKPVTNGDLVYAATVPSDRVLWDNSDVQAVLYAHNGGDVLNRFLSKSEMDEILRSIERLSGF